MLDLFRLRIDLVQREAHDVHKKEFKQTMTTHKFSRDRLTNLGQFHAMIGSIAYVASIGQPLEELGNRGITKCSVRFQELKAFLLPGVAINPLPPPQF